MPKKRLKTIPTVTELRESNSPRQLASKLRTALHQVQDCAGDLASCKQTLSQTQTALQNMTEDDQRELLKVKTLEAQVAQLQKELADCKAHNPQAGRPWAYIPSDGE